MISALSTAMRRGLALAMEQGELERQPGGYWTVPGEAMRGLSAGPLAGSSRYVPVATVRALHRRGLLEMRHGSAELTRPETGRPWARPTEAGREEGYHG
jgi:integrase